MSERATPEDLLFGSTTERTITDDVESIEVEQANSIPMDVDIQDIDPPSATLVSTRYPALQKQAFQKRTVQKPRPKKKDPDSLVYSPAQKEFIDLESLLEISDKSSDTPKSPDTPPPRLKAGSGEEPSDKKRKMDPYMLTNILMEGYSFAVIDDTLHCYDPNEGYWRCIPGKDSKDALRKMVPYELRPSITAAVLSEVYHWLKTDSQVISNDDLNKRKDYINFSDRAFSLKDKKTIDHKPGLYFQNVLQASCPVKREKKGSYYDPFIKSTFGGDKDTIRCFEEFLGLAISPVRDTKHAFFLYGPSNTGKSVILNVLHKTIGSEATSSLSFSQLGSEFAVANLLGKWLNISGEMSGVANKRLDLFKSLTGNDPVMACFKGKDHFQFYNQALLVFACNNFPPISPELVGSFAPRIIIFPFLNVVPKDRWIEDLSEKLYRERDIWLPRAIEGLIRLRERNYVFIETAAMLRCKERFFGETNSFLLFAKKHLQEDPDGQCTSRAIGQAYRSFCTMESLDILSDNVWSRILQETYPVKKCNITSGPEIETDASRYNSRGYKGVSLI